MNGTNAEATHGRGNPAGGDQTGPRAGRGSLHNLHAPSPPLEQCVDTFWLPGVPLEELPAGPPPAPDPYEILKRLGPSPFEGSSFPLIGFLASVYERVGRLARERTAR